MTALLYTAFVLAGAAALAIAAYLVWAVREVVRTLDRISGKE